LLFWVGAADEDAGGSVDGLEVDVSERGRFLVEEVGGMVFEEEELGRAARGAGVDEDWRETDGWERGWVEEGASIWESLVKREVKATALLETASKGLDLEEVGLRKEGGLGWREGCWDEGEAPFVAGVLLLSAANGLAGFLNVKLASRKVASATSRADDLSLRRAWVEASEVSFSWRVVWVFARVERIDARAWIRRERKDAGEEENTNISFASNVKVVLIDVDEEVPKQVVPHQRSSF
jgi:hypothetical protein